MNNSNLPMPNRERFLAICRGERPGDVSIIDCFNRPYIDTPEAWIKQGAPEEIKNRDSFDRYFQFDYHHPLREIVMDIARTDVQTKEGTPLGRSDILELEGGVLELQTPSRFYFTGPLVPVFEPKVLREDERHRVETTYGGQTVEVSKEFPWRMPRYLDHPVKDRATWNEFKKRLDPYTPGRWPSDWNAFVEKVNSEDVPTLLPLGGFFGMLREWMGLENLLYTFYDDPHLVEDMMDQMLYLGMEVAKRAVRDLRIDYVRFWEDMAYKTGPMISPDMFKKFMIPRYKKITDFLHSNGINIIYADTDGDINELIPIWLSECGVNLHRPLECTAGMDAVALRKKYGKNIILGGNIDKRAFAKGKDAIREEVMSKVPFLLETGGYFPALDQGLPPDISFENYRYFINLVREIGGMEKLPE